MIYTIGHKESYERCLAEYGSDCWKKGRDGEYDGGSVWDNSYDAALHAPADYSVFGVLATWGKDTEPSRSGGMWHDLLVSARIVAVSNDTMSQTSQTWGAASPGRANR